MIHIKKLGDGIVLNIVLLDNSGNQAKKIFHAVHAFEEELCPSLVKKLQHGNIERGYRLSTNDCVPQSTAMTMSYELRC